jgi:excisionase family DNA binding protein
MLLLNTNQIAVPRWDRPPQTLIGNFIRYEVVGQLRGAFCVTLARVPLEHELSNQTNLPPAKDGGAHHHPKAASETARPRRRRCRPPKGYLSIAQLSQRAGVGLSTAYSWIYSGRIPAAKWRGVLIVAEEAVDGFLAIKPLTQTDATESDEESGQ